MTSIALQEQRVEPRTRKHYEGTLCDCLTFCQSEGTEADFSPTSIALWLRPSV